MIKKGFTLAEVLITLTIIGVVSAITLPSLTSNTQDQQAYAGLKKIVNTLNHISDMSLANEGYTYGTENVTDLNSRNKVKSDDTITVATSVGMMYLRHGNLKSTNMGACSATFMDGTCVITATGSGDITVDTNGAATPNAFMQVNTDGTAVTTHGDRFSLHAVFASNGSVTVEPADAAARFAYNHR